MSLVWSHLLGKLYGVGLSVFLMFVCFVTMAYAINLIMSWWLLVMNVGKYAQVTNNPENDGCINAVLLV